MTQLGQSQTDTGGVSEYIYRTLEGVAMVY